MRLFNIRGAYIREGAYHVGGQVGGVLKLLILNFQALYLAISVPLSKHLAEVLLSKVWQELLLRSSKTRRTEGIVGGIFQRHFGWTNAEGTHVELRVLTVGEWPDIRCVRPDRLHTLTPEERKTITRRVWPYLRLGNDVLEEQYGVKDHVERFAK